MLHIVWVDFNHRLVRRQLPELSDLFDGDARLRPWVLAAFDIHEAVLTIGLVMMVTMFDSASVTVRVVTLTLGFTKSIVTVVSSRVLTRGAFWVAMFHY